MTWQEHCSSVNDNFFEEPVTGGLHNECRVKGLFLPETVENVLGNLLSEIYINVYQLILKIVIFQIRII